VRVHQATGVAGPYDAVSEQAAAYRRLLEDWGMAGGVHASLVAPGAPAGIELLDRLDAAPDDLVLIHYAGYVPGMAPLLDLPQRKLLLYHNVTPARYFWRVEPRVALTCELGRAHLPSWIAAARATAAVSSYNARELRSLGAADPRVVPILFDPERVRAPRGRPQEPDGDGRGVHAGGGKAQRGGGAGAEPEGAPLVLSVGRLAPHKRPDLVIRAFALLQRHLEPDARLLCVGPPVNPDYERRLEQLVVEVGARQVRLAGGLAQPELNAALAEASVFLSLSEHEGFCVPLLEALAAEVPTVARPSGGMPEVGADAVLWSEDSDPAVIADVTEDPDLAVVAELVQLAIRDAELRAELVRRGRRRVAHFSPQRVASELRSAVELALA